MGQLSRWQRIPLDPREDTQPFEIPAERTHRRSMILWGLAVAALVLILLLRFRYQ
jgi:hypothetical protein